MKIATWQLKGANNWKSADGRMDGRTRFFLQAIDYVLVDYTVMYTRTEIHAR